MVNKMVKEKYNITLLGDSISKGVIYDEDKDRYVIIKNSFCNIVGEKLKGVVYNAGKFGSTIIKGSKRLYEDLTKTTPDIVIIEFGGNDCDFNWEEVANSPYTSHEPNTNLDVFESTLKNIIENLNTKKIVPVLMTLPPLDPEKYYKWISKKSDTYAKNILTWLGCVNKIYSWHESYNTAIIKLAKETKTNLIDVRSSFLNTDNYTVYLCKDGIHPNERGHKIIADKILTYIENNYSFLINS
jgi:Lysophospholipase L1 and related esterases